MITIKVEGNKCYLTNQDANSGFVLNTNLMETVTLADLSLWVNEELDKRIARYNQCL